MPAKTIKKYIRIKWLKTKGKRKSLKQRKMIEYIKVPTDFSAGPRGVRGQLYLSVAVTVTKCHKLAG